MCTVTAGTLPLLFKGRSTAMSLCHDAQMQRAFIVGGERWKSDMHWVHNILSETLAARGGFRGIRVVYV